MESKSPEPQVSPLVAHAERELRLSELDSKDSSYGGALATSVMELVKTFSGQRHSGQSAAIVLALFDKVANWRPLTPLTDDPSEWNDVTQETMSTEERLRGLSLWQNSRAPSCFSNDKGKTYYDTSTNEYGIQTQHKEIEDAPAKNVQSSGRGTGSKTDKQKHQDQGGPEEGTGGPERPAGGPAPQPVS